ncbi:MAG: hypothetical protein IIC24_04180 [Chloroflexi bacterium]|nr:hypothetical protein [Chloroflexota bacterium]
MDKRDSFDIDDTGEEIAYITLPQAVIKARQVVRQEDAYYRERLGWQEIVWTEKQYEKRDDYYWVVLKFSQPTRGIAEVQTGEEEFVFDEVGNLVDRQVLLWPDGSSAPVEQDPTPEPSQPDITESSPKHSYTPTPTSASHPYADTIVSEPPDTSPRQSGSPYEPPLHAERTGVFLASPRRRIAAFVFDLILYTVTVGSAAGIGEWLRKPRRGGGGRAIRVWNSEIEDRPGRGEPFYLQEYVAGTPVSAVFLASRLNCSMEVRVAPRTL